MILDFLRISRRLIIDFSERTIVYTRVISDLQREIFHQPNKKSCIAQVFKHIELFFLGVGRRISMVLWLKWLVWLVCWVYGISTFVGYLMPNPFVCK